MKHFNLFCKRSCKAIGSEIRKLQTFKGGDCTFGARVRKTAGARSDCTVGARVRNTRSDYA